MSANWVNSGDPKSCRKNIPAAFPEYLTVWESADTLSVLTMHID